MFQFLLGVLHLAGNFRLVMRALAKPDAGAGPRFMTAPVRGRARCAGFALVLALLPAGANAQNAYITNEDGTVSVIDTATNKVTATIRVGVDPWAVVVTPDGTKVYVTNEGDNTVSVIATATNTVIAAIPVGVGPWGVAVTPDGARTYVANTGDKTVSVIATIPVGKGPVAFGKFIGKSPPVAYKATNKPRAVFVDRLNGSITFCPSAVHSGSSTNYFGKCARIGGLPIASLAGNAFVSISGTVAFAGNTATGIVKACTLNWDINTGQPLGSCIPIADPIQ